MAIQMEKPRIHVKTKNLQQIFDYCIESKTEFSVIPKNANDTWEIELGIKSIMDAIKWGMFLKANKIDLVENPLLDTSINVAITPKTLNNNTKTKTFRKNSTNQPTTSPIFNNNEKENALTKNNNSNFEQDEKTSLLFFEEDKKQSQQNELF